MVKDVSEGPHGYRYTVFQVPIGHAIGGVGPVEFVLSIAAMVKLGVTGVGRLGESSHSHVCSVYFGLYGRVGVMIWKSSVHSVDSTAFLWEGIVFWFVIMASCVLGAFSETDAEALYEPQEFWGFVLNLMDGLMKMFPFSLL